ncbi:MAG: hypothetical protein C0606_03530 [Hyphomicrobiales bacterium]|nr:MAG: hypothetical protein C0606_03530 [Hyphomicrobiales bacterium]
MTARIYRPSKNAMQSGQAKTHRWLLEYEPEAARTVDPLMGYTSSTDMRQQIKMSFESKEDAISYAKRNGIAYRVIEPKEKAEKRHSYSDNFRFDRVGVWTH